MSGAHELEYDIVQYKVNNIDNFASPVNFE